MEDGAGFGVGAQCPVPEGVSQGPGGVGGGSADDKQVSGSTLAMLPGHAKQGIQGHHA